jgi:Pyruvate/2-oxoacid:ferredoxin oxidoreductase delta subunit
MSDHQTVWIDVERCTGCAVCAEICPLEAISMTGGKAHVDEKTCSGCQACVDPCPEDAIQPLIQGEIIRLEERPAPAALRSRPLAETAGVAVAVAAVSLLAKVARFLARVVGHWLAELSIAAQQPLRTTAQLSSSAGADRPIGSRRRARHRRRGR